MTGFYPPSLRGGAADVAIFPGAVIARSGATKRSPAYFAALAMTGTISSSSRGAERRGDLQATGHGSRDCFAALAMTGIYPPSEGDCFAALAMTGIYPPSLRGGAADDAIFPGAVIARSAATRRSPGHWPRFQRLLRCARNDGILFTVFARRHGRRRNLQLTSLRSQ
jgi:hypothetical protein